MQLLRGLSPALFVLLLLSAPFALSQSQSLHGIDVTDLTRSPALGDPVVLWGEGLPVEEIAVPVCHALKPRT